MTNEGTPRDQIIGRAVAAHMAARGWTRTDLANRLGVTLGTASRRLNGSQAWKLNDLQTLAEAFGVAASDLMDGRVHARSDGRAA